jgi:hypothetical protein
VLDEARDSAGAAWAYTSLGMLEASADHPEEARAAFLAGGAIFLRDDDLAGQIICLQALGSLAARAGDDSTAVRLAIAAQQRARQLGLDPPAIPMIVGPLADARSHLSADDIDREREAASQIEVRPYLEAALTTRTALMRVNESFVAHPKLAQGAPEAGSPRRRQPSDRGD